MRTQRKDIVREMDISEAVNTAFLCVFRAEDTLPPTLPEWERKEAVESIKIVRRDINKLMKDLNPYKALGC